MSSEYDNFFPHPQKGFSSVEAAQFIKKELPQFKGWIHWDSYGNVDSYIAMGGLSTVIMESRKSEGIIAGWKWRRVDTSYPDISYWADGYANWTGVIEFRNTGTEKRFFIFSYLSSLGQVGRFYLVYVDELKVINKFSKEIAAVFNKKDGMIPVRVWNGPDFFLPHETKERLFLPEDMKQDIMQQVSMFFENRDRYKEMGIPYRRGLLFSGTPGNGKTLALRHIIREAYKEYKAQAWVLNIDVETDERDLGNLLRAASQNDTAGIVFLEDMDSLTRESKMTRTGLLAQLDGVNPKEGVLIVGTTNNPGDIDPALAKRPSRFDRIWNFSPPDAGLRRDYLRWAFPDSKLIESLVEKTAEWSFAFLNELRVTAGFYAINAGQEIVDDKDIQKALELLDKQFKTKL